MEDVIVPAGDRYGGFRQPMGATVATLEDFRSRCYRMQHRKLGDTGLEVSVLGFGASPLGEEFGPIEPSEGERAVRFAVDHGVTFFDVAPYYGRTLAEQRLGKALEGLRRRVVLSSKCCRYGARRFDFSAASVRKSVEGSLRRLRTDCLDLLIVHDIEFGGLGQVAGEAIPAAQRLKQEGKTRAVGISGLPLNILRQAASQAPVDVILSYARYNLMAGDLDTVLRPFVEQRGLGLVNASPLHLGLLTEQGPPPWHPAGDEVKAAARRVAELCRENGRDVSQVALRYCLDYPHVASTLVGMSAPAQVEANLRALETPNDPALLEEIVRLVAPVRNRVWPSGRPENQD